jgi:hypothetical protein
MNAAISLPPGVTTTGVGMRRGRCTMTTDLGGEGGPLHGKGAKSQTICLAGKANDTPPRTIDAMTLLFSLSLAVALPPDAIIAPCGSPGPVIHADACWLLDVGRAGTALGTSTLTVGAGRVYLGAVDPRLNGLVVHLEALQPVGNPGTLVSVGMVGADTPRGLGSRATPGDLWRLAQDALIGHRASHDHIVRFGDDAFLAQRGGRTAQVAWLTEEHVITVSVTMLAGIDRRATSLALALAHLVHERVANDVQTWPLSGSTW